ncbi:hypothetical protein DdX_19505 [Ditylenchus destructor]|uniref:Uncharacterized protein n=1 Tax=Ditylenchus destructor TaxID=166010 RepID=A0AAD4QX82_9BILA|nr:hypothetical protein DdX_19505 [Ditylenchus destructor]
MHAERRRKLVATVFIILISIPGPGDGAKSAQNLTKAATDDATGTDAANSTAPSEDRIKCDRYVYDLSSDDDNEKNIVNALEEHSANMLERVNEFLKEKQELVLEKIDSTRAKYTVFKFIYDWAKQILNLPFNVFVFWWFRRFMNHWLKHKAKCLGLKWDKINTKDVHLSTCHPFRTQLRWLMMFVKARFGDKIVDGDVLVNDFPCVKKYWGRKWMGMSKKVADKTIQAAQDKGATVPDEYLNYDAQEEVDTEEDAIINSTMAVDKKSDDTATRSKRDITYLYNQLEGNNTNSRYKREMTALFGAKMPVDIACIIILGMAAAGIGICALSVHIVRRKVKQLRRKA